MLKQKQRKQVSSSQILSLEQKKSANFQLNHLAFSDTSELLKISYALLISTSEIQTISDINYT